MITPYRHLSDNDFFDDSRPLPDLPHVKPFFFVPPLEDKPQNPIMDNLKIEEANINLPKRKSRVETQVKDKPEDGSLEDTKRKVEMEMEMLWTEAAKQKPRNGLLSWDRLRATHPIKASRTAFLSEQDEYVWFSARHHVQPRLRDPTHVITTTTQHELFTSLKTTVLGISSQLHIWNSDLERFLQVGTDKQAKTRILLVDGKDDIVSQSFTTRFITIGTLLRRLELLLSSLRTRSAKEGPTIHSLAHAVSATLDYIRQKLMECPPSNVPDEKVCLTQIWSYFAPYEDLLVALADLCGRSESFKTTEYLHLEPDPVPLLSRLYEHLTLHFERQSSHLIRSVMAFILSSTSYEYIQHVAHSIGFGGQPKSGKPKAGVSELDNEDEDEEDDIFNLLDSIETKFPAFFRPEMLNLLPAAQKSLVLLKIAQPDHTLLVNGTGTSVPKTEVRWLWRTDEVEAVWNGRPLPSPAVPSFESGRPMLLGPSTISYNSELSEFRMFDLEPGVVEFVGHPSNYKNCTGTSVANISSFISSFPTTLPPITPTLSSLASLTFQSLTEHASTLSTALLRIFIDQPGKLNFCTHLILLRDFLLVSNPEFKSKLIVALFDDAGEFRTESSSAHSLSVRAVRQRMRETYGRKVDKQQGGQENKDQGSKMPWAVGLAPHLLERQTWPPVGADLAFYLRTVIMDSLDRTERQSNKDDEQEAGGRGNTTEAIVLEEAEWRLGFAIKDLPVGSGKEKWMDPLSIEALDFLYMDYKPPRPLEVLISPEILSKYQRMFEFILRLLRVENALKSLFRMSTHRTDGTSLFPTLSKSRQLLLHFRFVAQAFVSGLSGYVFDSAIRGNFDPFLSQLTFSPAATHDDRRPSFSDVFELAQCHSALLNDILSACLLRSGQKGVGDLLRHSMETVLEFTIVVGELQRERLEEYQASPIIEDLYKKFCVKMTMLAKVLKGLIDKSPSRPTVLQDYYMGGSQRPTGGLDALYHLLLRLDLSDWWSSRNLKTQK